MMKRITIYLVCVLVALTAVAYQTKNNKVENITNEASLVIDVREVDEFAMGHIEGSINIPLSVVVDSVDMIKSHEHVVLVCRSGHRSALAVDALHTLGLSNISNGGGWTDYLKKINR